MGHSTNKNTNTDKTISHTFGSFKMVFSDFSIILIIFRIDFEI